MIWNGSGKMGKAYPEKNYSDPMFRTCRTFLENEKEKMKQGQRR